MRTILKVATAASVAGAMMLAVATPGEARGGRNAALIGGLAAGALIGAAAANANNGYYYEPRPRYYYEPGYAYEPAPVYVDPGPVYYSPRYRSDSSECAYGLGSTRC